MSCDEVISVNGLVKKFEIYENPSKRLKQFIYPKVAKAFSLPEKKFHKDFYALNNVSFKVRKGETLGIIGRNGSGKSTLLQIICGTLAASEGVVKTSGRIAALLELGAGFNPEFTGRENIYLNSAILGLSKKEIDERFSLIEDFADIGEFIDQPVKTYSSGMYVRLAFAVIAHVDADILIVDEALAVGDAVFTQKCMRFIRDFQKKGTLLFVSHDMGAIQNLCSRSIWLSHGVVKADGDSKKVAEKYLKSTLQDSYGDDVLLEDTSEYSEELTNNSVENPIINYEAKFEVSDNLVQADGWNTGAGAIKSISLFSASGKRMNFFEGGEKIKIIIKAIAFNEFKKPIIGFIVKDRLGQDLFGENTLKFTSLNSIACEAGEIIEAEFIFKLPMLPNGQYVMMASLADGTQYENTQHHYMHNALVLNVSSSKVRYGLVGVEFENASLRKAN